MGAHDTIIASTGDPELDTLLTELGGSESSAWEEPLRQALTMMYADAQARALHGLRYRVYESAWDSILDEHFNDLPDSAHRGPKAKAAEVAIDQFIRAALHEVMAEGTPERFTDSAARQWADRAVYEFCAQFPFGLNSDRGERALRKKVVAKVAPDAKAIVETLKDARKRTKKAKVQA